MTTAAAPAPIQIYNHDIAGLVSRMQRFMLELIGSSSAGVSMMSSYDQARLTAYLAAITTYQTWVTGAPQLDLPETNKTLWTVSPLVAVTEVENESVNDLLRILNLACLELLSSQSARLPAGLVSFDSARLTAYVTKLQNFLTAYIQVATPLDLPESSPEVPMAPQGNTGV
jgi:hypothetical protein